MYQPPRFAWFATASAIRLVSNGAGAPPDPDPATAPTNRRSSACRRAAAAHSRDGCDPSFEKTYT